MTNISDDFNALTGKYAHLKPNKNIRLSTEPITIITTDGDKIKCKGTLYLQLQPSLYFTVQVVIAYSPALRLGFDEFRIVFDKDPSLEWFISSKNASSSDNIVRFTASPCRALINFPHTLELASASFHLINFPNYFGLPIMHSDMRSNLGGLELIFDNWKIKINSTPFTERNVKELDATGGYAITHVGNIERIDGNLFSSQAALDLTRDLMYLLSFANGMWVNPILISGLDSKCKEIWKGWGIHFTHPWKKTMSWFDNHHASVILPHVYSGYIKRIQDPNWTEVIRLAIYWYIQTNIPNVDSALILGQTALELLSWNYLVIDKRLISRTQFKKVNNTATNIRCLLTECGIPLVIPTKKSNAELVQFAETEKDGVDLITKVRNDLVHPEKNKTYKGVQYYHVLNLQQWYIELVLLRLMNYDGNYFNRLNKDLWAGNVEPVPWN